ncbi:hypothetical protein D0X99_10065 [Algoriphagus lacus]|uniref:Uncharacterized protein n=1 Tax=Algoriphagus lacus TaxID=2056311 RepID=A0A418PSA5_9BACT|nr:hypothetical protein [Algoriphagus lacus]RIW15759.1 hypothetical protein D0X99_10065 [Algoriphagus lacus]
MEKESLEELKSLIEEEIYLIPEDRKAILAQLEGIPTANLDVKPIPEAITPVEHQPQKESVVIPVSSSQPEPQSIVEELLVEPIKIRGNFSKGVLILHEEGELSAEVMDMLVKMINACGHSMNEVGLVASESLEGRSMEDFLALNSHTVLKFGRIKHPINALPAPSYEVFAENETEYLFADSLTMIAEDKNLKKKLWTSLQVLFNLTSK